MDFQLSKTVPAIPLALKLSEIFSVEIAMKFCKIHFLMKIVENGGFSPAKPPKMTKIRFEGVKIRSDAIGSKLCILMVNPFC